MEQYLYGFCGELMSFFTFNFMGDQMMRDKIITLSKALSEHKARFNISIPLQSNSTKKHQEFISMQQESERLLLKIEAVFGKFGWEYAINSRLMMQAIGLRIGYPGMMPLDRYPSWASAIIAKSRWQRNQHIVEQWTCLLSTELDTNDSIFAGLLPFSSILRQIPEATNICDAFIILLERIHDTFLE